MTLSREDHVSCDFQHNRHNNLHKLSLGFCYFLIFMFLCNIFHKWKIERVLDAGILKAQYSNSHC